MTRRMHARVENAQVAAVEVTADASEQTLLVLHIDQHLGAFPDPCQPGAHNRALAVDFAEQCARVPRDVLRTVSKKVNNIELLPKRVARFIR